MKQEETRLQAILARDPDNVGALAGMAWVRSRQKNYLAAVSYLEQAKQKHPDDPALTVALNLDRFRVIEAEADEALASGDLASAEKFYLQAIRIRPHCREAEAGLHSTLLLEQKSAAAVGKGGLAER